MRRLFSGHSKLHTHCLRFLPFVLKRSLCQHESLGDSQFRNKPAVVLCSARKKCGPSVDSKSNDHRDFVFCEGNRPMQERNPENVNESALPVGSVELVEDRCFSRTSIS